MILSKTRRGDYVADREQTRITFAFGSGRESELQERWRIARVESATRDGVAKAVSFYDGDMSRNVARFNLAVWTISTKQREPASLFSLAYPPTEYATQAALRDAILEAAP